MSTRAADGSAYARQEGHSRADLTRVGRGTPMGELLRRYWHPVGVAADAGSVPRKVRILGEDLILFRDGNGQAGLVHSRCAHRGASLFYGKIEERGIRCCYHGWLFDVTGHCLEQPCEPGRQGNRGWIRQPWYPVAERYGLIFAYLGPPDKQPVLPRYDILERLAPAEWIEADDSSIGSGGGTIVPCNWLQHFENVVDPYHLPILHGSFSGTQFVDLMAILPEVTFSASERGVQAVQVRKLDDGRRFHRVTEAVLPTLRVVPSPHVRRFQAVESLGWVLPIDDVHFRIYAAGRVIRTGQLAAMRSTFNGKQWHELTDEEHQRYPGDYEAQVSQGPITLHSEEHLATSDRGVVLLRRLLEKQMQAVADGADPVGVSFDEQAPAVVFEAGNFLQNDD